jgi:hypothetical protein
VRAILDYLRLRNNEYKKYKQINSSGVYIDVFVETFKHKVRVLIDKSTLFSDILKFYNSTNINNYVKLLNLIDFTNQNVCNEIAFGELTSIIAEPPPGSPIILHTEDSEGTSEVPANSESDSLINDNDSSSSGSVKELTQYFENTNI